MRTCDTCHEEAMEHGGNVVPVYKFGIIRHWRPVTNWARYSSTGTPNKVKPGTPVIFCERPPKLEKKLVEVGGRRASKKLYS